jgi:hypothetical protein
LDAVNVSHVGFVVTGPGFKRRRDVSPAGHKADGSGSSGEGAAPVSMSVAEDGGGFSAFRGEGSSSVSLGNIFFFNVRVVFVFS